MRKIGIVSEYFYPHLGGITEHVNFFSRELARRGFEVVILTGYEGEEPNIDLPANVRLVHLGKTLPIYSNDSFAKITFGWNLGRRVKEVLAREKFDLLHIHSPVMPTLPLLFQKYTDTITVGTLHTFFDSIDSVFFYRLFRQFVQQYLNKLDGIIAVGPACIESMSQFYQFDYTVIPNGVDTEWFSRSAEKIERFSEAAPTILFLGRLDPRNGLTALLDAFPAVIQKIPQARLVVVGDGPMRPYYENHSGHLLNHNIFFEGQIDGSRPAYYAACDVFCFPATKAAFSITILEAMSAGKPIVTSDNPGFRDAIEHGVSGMLVKVGDIQALAEALIRILTDKDFATRLSQNAMKKVQNYSWSRITDRVLDYYNQISLKKRGVPFAS